MRRQFSFGLFAQSRHSRPFAEHFIERLDRVDCHVLTLGQADVHTRKADAFDKLGLQALLPAAKPIG
ncbi:hypothetical protein X759_31245 [Mesorhizobium sp. LSHC420B00]|nr:hypothetical protein X759_31245 [Mesorhizobium sp. LSHC420B00]